MDSKGVWGIRCIACAQFADPKDEAEKHRAGAARSCAKFAMCGPSVQMCNFLRHAALDWRKECCYRLLGNSGTGFPNIAPSIADFMSVWQEIVKG